MLTISRWARGNLRADHKNRTFRESTLARKRIGFHAITRQEGRFAHDPFEMLLSRAVFVVCLVLQSDPNRAIGPVISNHW